MLVWVLALLLAAPVSPRAHRDKALALLAQGREEDAVAELKLAISGDANDQVAHHELGKILFKRGKLAEAIVQFDAAVKLQPKDATAWYNLAYASRKARQFEAAAAAYRRYAELAPDDADAWFGLAECLREAGRGAEAVTAYQTYVVKEKRPAEQKWVDKARVRIAELSGGEKPATPPPAPAAATAVDARERLAQGDALLAAKDLRGALFAYQDAVIADPKSFAALAGVAQVYGLLGHDDDAVDYWKSALALDPQSKVAREGLLAAQERRAARAAPARMTPAPAPPAAAPLVTTGETAALDHYAAGAALVRERKYAEALVELDKSLQAKPTLAVALVARGSARIGLGQFNDAIADYLAAQRADAAMAAPLFGLAEAYRALGQKGRAIELYRAFAASSAPDAQESLKQYALRNAEALASHP